MKTTARLGTLERPVASCGEQTADAESDYWYRLEKSGQADDVNGADR